MMKMKRRVSSVLWSIVLLPLLFSVGGLIGCPAGSTKEVVQFDDAGVDGGAVPVVDDAGGADAGVGVVRVPQVELVILSGDGGRRFAGGDGGLGVEVEPANAIELRITPRLRAPRIRLFDWNDQLVESDDTELGSEAGAGPGGFGYRIGLLEPLRAGRTYTLRIDSEVAPTLLDESGRELNELRLPIRVLGEPEPKDKPSPSRKRRRR